MPFLKNQFEDIQGLNQCLALRCPNGSESHTQQPWAAMGPGGGDRLRGKTTAKEEDILQHQDSDSHLEPLGGLNHPGDRRGGGGGK